MTITQEQKSRLSLLANPVNKFFGKKFPADTYYYFVIKKVNFFEKIQR